MAVKGAGVHACVSFFDCMRPRLIGQRCEIVHFMVACWRRHFCSVHAWGSDDWLLYTVYEQAV